MEVCSSSLKVTRIVMGKRPESQLHKNIYNMFIVISKHIRYFGILGTVLHDKRRQSKSQVRIILTGENEKY